MALLQKETEKEGYDLVDEHKTNHSSSANCLDENLFKDTPENDLTTKDITKENCIKMLRGALKNMEYYQLIITNLYNAKIGNNKETNIALVNTKFALLSASEYIKDKICSITK